MSTVKCSTVHDWKRKAYQLIGQQIPCVCLCVSKFPLGTLAPEKLATGTLAFRTLAPETLATEKLALGTLAFGTLAQETLAIGILAFGTLAQ